MRQICLLLGLIIFPMTVSYANERMSTIESISLAYDLVKGSVHVEAVHPSNNWEVDYIRMMTISVNGQVVTTENYDHQTTAEGFSEDVDLKAQPGDVISVALFCTGGSSMTQDLTVTASGGTVQPDQGVNGALSNSEDSTANSP